MKPLLTIIVNPLPDSISMEIISDKQWFYENVLCLLSNAAKYCDGGTVTVTVEHSSVIPPESQSQSQRTVTESSDVTLVDRACTSTSTSPVPPQPGIIISVEDTGIGISEDRRKDLFKPLKQTDRQSGGTGLGLYCLSNRVSALNGTRGVSSRTNGLQGSLFWFAIPYHPPPHFLTTLTTHSMGDLQKISPCSLSPVELELELSSQENIAALMTSSIPFVPIPTPIPTPIPILIPNPLSISIPSIHRNQLGNLRFLVVDDSPSIVKVLNRVLSNQKYAVDTAENGKFALDRMKEAFVSRSLDIVLMDLQMPIMDGIEAVTLYRQYEDSQRSQSSSIYPSPFCSLSTSGATSTLSASSAASSAHASPKESSPSPGERSPSYPSMREIDHDHDTDTLKVNNSLFIIGMSASSDEKYEVAALTAGMNYFLPKPFTMNELQPLIERFRTIQEA